MTVRVELNRQGVRQLLREPQLGQALLGMGERIAGAASDVDRDLQYRAELHAAGPGRVRVHVYTANPAAMAEEPVDRNLLRAFGQARI